MTTVRKRLVGYPTPAKQIEEHFDSMIRTVESREPDWSWRKRGATAYFERALRIWQAARQTEDESTMSLSTALQAQLYSIQLICELGERLNAIAGTLAELEQKLRN